MWEGVVHVFDLAGHPTATRAYAWSSPIEGSTKRRFFAVLHTERINSPLEAVRAAIVAEHKQQSGGLRRETTSKTEDLGASSIAACASQKAADNASGCSPSIRHHRRKAGSGNHCRRPEAKVAAAWRHRCDKSSPTRLV